MNILHSLALAILAIGAAHAEEITFVASGQVKWASDPNDPSLQGVFTNAVGVGDDVRIFYTFESTTPASLSDSHFAQYPAIKNIRVEVSENVWTLVPCAECNDNNRIIVFNDNFQDDSRFWDVYQAVGTNQRPQGGFRMILLNLDQAAATAPVLALSSTDLPLAPPDPNAFADAGFMLLSSDGVTAIDISGTITALRKVSPKTPAELLVDLAQAVVAMNVQAGISNSLDAKLDNAIAALDRAKEGDRNMASSMLYSFINEVNAQRGKKLTSGQADQLAAEALAIIDALSQT
jgi:hypothetical protein